MDPLTRSAKLRQEADYVMHAIGLPTILAPYGPVAFIGSYFLLLTDSVVTADSLPWKPK